MNVLSGSVARRLELLDAVARRTGNAVIVTDADAHIEWVNPGFERLTGFAADEVIGCKPGDLLQGPETDVETRRTMAAAIAAQQPFDVVILNYTRTGHQYWVRIDAAPIVRDDGVHSGYIAIETNVTEQRIGEVRESVLRDIGVELLQCSTVTDAARVAVERLVRTFDVRAASIWVVEPGRPNLRHVAAACSGPEAHAWREACEQTTFRRGFDWVVGVGAPGVAWGTAAPCQKTDFWEPDQNGALSRRARAARDAGIRTVCAVPVLAADGVNAVIEIGGSHNYPGFERLPALVEQVAQQFGAFVVQRRNQAAYEELFQHSPDALLVVDDDDAIVRANARARALFGDPENRKLSALFSQPLDLSGASLELAPHLPPAGGVFGLRADGSEFPVEVSVSDTQVHGAAGTIVAVRDLTERRRTEAALRRSLHEKTTLVQEVHHRVKNNLQVISSLVSLQCARVSSPEVQAELLDTSRRIQSVALVHQLLYASDNLAMIDLLDYLRSLASSLQGSMGPEVELHVSGDPVFVTVEQASPIGLVINELLLNAAKHGRSETGECRVSVELGCRDEKIRIFVRDEGPGFDPSRVHSGSMGQTLIRALCRQLRAEIAYATTDGTPGTTVHLAFDQDCVT